MPASYPSTHFNELRDALLEATTREELGDAYMIARKGWTEGHLHESEWATIMNDHAGLKEVFPEAPIVPLIAFG